MFLRSATERQKVNSRKVDEVFTEDEVGKASAGWLLGSNPRARLGLRPIRRGFASRRNPPRIS